MNLNSNDEVLHDFLPFLRIYKDGRIERYILNETVQPGLDPTTGAQSKDVVISEEPKIGARIFLPKMNAAQPKRLPLLVHYHGGGFCTGSAFCPITRSSLTKFVSLANIIAISIDYRLAPEHPLPIAYEDCWAGLKWVAAHAKWNGPEPWLNEYVDFGKVHLEGESSGASLAHDVAIRASLNPLDGVKIIGLSLVHPYFATRDPDMIIQYLYPTNSGTDDDPRLNPGRHPRLAELVCERVLVCVAEKSLFRNRGVSYYQALMRSGWVGIAEFLETEDEGHCFHLFEPNPTIVGPFLYKLASFISDDVQWNLL